MISLENVTKIMKQQLVLDHISLTLPAKKVIGFQGRNGSGKTMLFRAICGLITLNEGQVKIDGSVIGKGAIASNIGLLLENPRFLDHMSGRENLKYLQLLKGKKDEKEIDDLMDRVGLSAAKTKVFARIPWE